MKVGKRFIFYEDVHGYIKCHYTKEKVLYVDEVIVYKEFRKQGYGRLMVNKLPIGCKLLASPIPDEDKSIEDIDLVKFYESCGFILTKDVLGNNYMERIL